MAVALSGGADSVCLLQVFYENKAAYKIALSAVTCEHGVRGKESLSDLEFVKLFCKEREIPLFVFSEDVPTRAKLSGRGLEEEGRIFRYECFSKLLDEGETDFIATAHHEGDLAETVLFRLVRGTSLAGIPAIKERDGIVRPFLNVSKEEILSYLRERKISYVIDETNDDENYSRNLIRKSVLPLLEKVVRGAGEHIADFARRAQEDNEFLSSLAEGATRKDGDEIMIAVDLPRPLFFRAASKAIFALGGTNYGEGLLCEIEKLQSLQSGKKVCFSKIEAIREQNEIVFYKPREPFEGEISFAEGSFEAGAYRAILSRKERAGALYADFCKIPKDCVIRTRREGDTFTPFGGKEKSLKKFLTDKKIPARKSALLPLLAKGSVVYAVFGVEISDLIKVTETTNVRVYLTLERNMKKD